MGRTSKCFRSRRRVSHAAGFALLAELPRPLAAPEQRRGPWLVLGVLARAALL
jgi:hypothetical protein